MAFANAVRRLVPACMSLAGSRLAPVPARHWQQAEVGYRLSVPALAAAMCRPYQAIYDKEQQSCWNCHHHLKRKELICKSCDVIQPANASLNFFELLDLPETFDLKEAELEQCYKRLQWKLHPDKTVLRTEPEKVFSAEQASLINSAYATLRKPLSRANYMLTRKGVSPEAEERTIENSRLLAEVLEARETIEDTNDRETLKRLFLENRAQQEKLNAALSQAFSNDKLHDAAQLTTELTYLTRLQQEITKKL